MNPSNPQILDTTDQHVCVYMYIIIYIYIYVYVCIYIYMYIYTYTCIHVTGYIGIPERQKLPWCPFIKHLSRGNAWSGELKWWGS